MAWREEARALAEQAQRALGQGLEQVQERVEEARRRRQLADLARELGLLVYRGRRAGELDEPAVAELVARMAAVEASLPPPAGGAPPAGWRLDDLEPPAGPPEAG